jgi:RNA polymerase sigma-70 factor (ECF subfamily)
LVISVVYRVAKRWGETRPEILDELVQDCYLHLYKNNQRVLREFKPRNEESIFGFLKVVAANVTHDYLRAQGAAKRGASETTNSDETVAEFAPGEHPEAKIQQEVLLREVEDCLNRNLRGEDAGKFKAIFWLYYRQGCTATSIAQIKTFGLTTKGVESVIHRLTSILRRELEQKPHMQAKSLTESKGTGAD